MIGLSWTRCRQSLRATNFRLPAFHLYTNVDLHFFVASRRDRSHSSWARQASGHDVPSRKSPTRARPLCAWSPRSKAMESAADASTATLNTADWRTCRDTSQKLAARYTARHCHQRREGETPQTRSRRFPRSPRASAGWQPGPQPRQRPQRAQPPTEFAAGRLRFPRPPRLFMLCTNDAHPRDCIVDLIRQTTRIVSKLKSTRYIDLSFHTHTTTVTKSFKVRGPPHCSLPHSLSRDYRVAMVRTIATFQRNRDGAIFRSMNISNTRSWSVNLSVCVCLCVRSSCHPVILCALCLSCASPSVVCAPGTRVHEHYNEETKSRCICVPKASYLCGACALYACVHANAS